MTFALARSLMLADAVKPEALAEALFASATRGTSLVRALLAARAIDPARLDQHLERGDAPYMRHVAPVLSLVQQLPAELCERLLALPVRRDPRTGTVDVAVVDARDAHAVEEIAYWLKSPVRMVRTSLVSMETALRQLHARPEGGVRPLAPPMGAPPEAIPPVRPRVSTPLYGTPIVDGAASPPPDGAAAEPDGAQLSERDTVDEDEVRALVGTSPNIPIPLMRKSIVPAAIVEIGPEPAPPPVRPPRLTPSLVDDDDNSHEPYTQPILDLRRRKSIPPDRLDAIPPAPATTRGPFSPNATWPPFDDPAAKLAAIRSATERDAILELLVNAVTSVARRVAVFAVRRDAVVGWACSPEMGERATLRAAKMPLPAVSDSVLAAALTTDDALLVRIPKDAAHAPLLAALRSPPSGEVALVGVRVEGKPVALVLADELSDTMTATRRLQEVARAASDALARLLREKRK